MQTLVTPLVTLFIFWVTFRGELAKLFLSKNIDKQQDIYVSLYSDLYNQTKYLKSIFALLFQVQDISKKERVHSRIDLIDKHQIDASFSLYANEGIQELVSEWISEREDFLAGAALCASNTEISQLDFESIKKQMNISLEKCNMLFEEIRNSIRTAIRIQ